VTELLSRMLLGATLGLAMVLLLRRPARRLFGAGPAFTLWLLPIALMLAPLLPRGWAPAAIVVLPGMTVTPHFVAGTSSATFAIDWAHELVAVWLFGAAAGLLRLALHYFRLVRGTRAAPIGWMCTLAEAAPNLDQRRVRVHGTGPAVLWALPRSLILLPNDFTTRFDNAATRELVLRHELTHVRRGDALWSVVMEIATALLWFHPLAWIARARFRLDQELACDAASLRALPERTANYARALLDSVAVQPAPVLIPWLAEPQLKERLAMIARIPPGVLRRRVGFVATAMLLAGGLYVAGGRAPAQAGTPTDTGVSSPKLEYQHSPEYPATAIQKGEQGMVVLTLAIDSTGRVTKVAVDAAKTTAPAVLQDAAAQSASNWLFKPGMKDGRPVAGRVQVPVTFLLKPHSLSARAIRATRLDGKTYYSCVACRLFDASRSPRK